MFLWSAHDVVNHHRRRYTKRELTERVHAAGFTIERAGYWNLSLFLPGAVPRLIEKIIPKKKKQSYLKEHSPIVNNLMKYILLAENRICQHINLPFGMSVFVVARKSGKNNKGVLG